MSSVATTARGAQQDRPAWLAYVGVGYVVLALFVTLNVVLVAWGSPAPRVTQWLEQGGRLPGAGGLAVLGWAGVVITVLAAWRGEVSRRQWQLTAAVGVWIGSAALSMTVHGAMQDGRFWSVAAASVGVAAAGALVPFHLLRRLMVGLGWFFGWGSVVAAVSDLLFDWPPVLLDDSPRYGQWLSMVGLDVGEVASLNGVTPGRVYVGLTCAVLLVFAVRAAPGLWTWIMSAGLVVATLWSFSRTGMVAMVVGLLVTFIPFERSRRFVWPLAALLVFILLPLALSAWLRTTSVSDGTTVWRFDLWQDTLSNPQVWMPFGVGPKPASPGYADHAHQQFLEALAIGGWLGLAGCLAFVVMAMWIAVRVAGLDNRATIGVVFVMGAIFQVDVFTYSANYTNLNNAYILIVAIVVSAAGILKPDAGAVGVAGTLRPAEPAAAAG